MKLSMRAVQIRIVFGVYLEVTPDEVRTKLGILGIFSSGDVPVPNLSGYLRSEYADFHLTGLTS